MVCEMSFPCGLLYTFSVCTFFNVVSLWPVVHRFLMDCCKPLMSYPYGLLYIAFLWIVASRFPYGLIYVVSLIEHLVDFNVPSTVQGHLRRSVKWMDSWVHV